MEHPQCPIARGRGSSGRVGATGLSPPPCGEGLGGVLATPAEAQSSPTLNDISAFRPLHRQKRRLPAICNLRFLARRRYGRTDLPSQGIAMPNRRAINPMRKPLRILILLLVAMRLLVLASCGRDYDWHQKLTVEIETPEGLKTGSSVMSAQLIDTHGPFVPAEASGVSFRLHGEAVALEVSQGRYLFALIGSVPALNWLIYPTMDSAKAGALMENGDEGGNVKAALKRNEYPLLVTFDDINDPATVKRVEPANLEATFGPGYRLTGMTLSLTNEPVTKGKLEKMLGWWHERQLLKRPWRSLSYEQQELLSSSAWTSRL